nr:MAG TPA: hypothetical protein [Caudoviricetes sp.]
MGYNKITLYGQQICDYLHIQGDDSNLDDLKYVDAEPSQWKENTLLSARFNGDLTAGNSSMLTRITGYEVRRRNGATPYTDYVCTIKESNSENKSNFIIDYLVGNKTQYTYYLYPGLSSVKENKDLILSPNISEEVETKWSCWSLLVVDDSDEDNVFYLNKMFKFGLNVSVDDMSNNASVSVVPNFTYYPTIQYGSTNYWSGGLTSLCGYVSCVDNEYTEPVNIKTELKSLTSDMRRKFLKDPDGSVYEVKITSPINISRKDGLSDGVKSIKIGWAEVGEVSGKSVINNPNKPTQEWLLTESGIAVPYANYVWDNDSRWDNTLKWTDNEERPSIKRAINLT